MIRFNLSLPGEKTLREKIEIIFNIRQGSRFSRGFRHLFEYRRIKAILGGTLIFVVLGASVLSPQVSALATIQETEQVTLSPEVIELTTKSGFRAPLDEVKITQGFSSFHPALDLDGITGDPVYPIMKGTIESVIYSRWDLGQHLIINHGSGLKSLYAHLSKIEVEAGEKVETDQIIGRLGKSGRSFGDHLHLEVFDNDRRVNPRIILPLN